MALTLPFIKSQPFFWLILSHSSFPFLCCRAVESRRLRAQVTGLEAEAGAHVVHVAQLTAEAQAGEKRLEDLRRHLSDATATAERHLEELKAERTAGQVPGVMFVGRVAKPWGQ